jgi:glycerol-3-phosphate O-acyltransferase
MARTGIAEDFRVAGWFNRIISQWLLRNIPYSDENVRSVIDLAQRSHVVFVLPFKNALLMAALKQAAFERGLPKNVSIVYLKTPRTLFSRKPAQNIPLDKLILDQLKNQSPTVLLPHLLVLGRRRARAERSTLDLVFGARDSPGFLRLFLRLILGKRQAQWQIGEPIDLPSPKPTHHTRFDLRRQFRRLEDIHIGPKAKSYQRIRNETLRDPSLRAYLDGTTKETGVKRTDLLKKSRTYFEEIAAHFDGDVVRVVHLALRFVFHRLYDGIFWNTNDIAQLRKASLKGPLILLPTHKSHMDYLVLSYLLYSEGLMPPHIAAGANLSFFPLGSLFRRGGAYFIRRQFKGDPLYTKVVRAYLNRLLKEGFTQEFFIEGGRTRTGKTLPPKLGLLSIYIDCLCSERFQDAVFVPISISYERIVESQSYDEEQSGKEKTKESAKGLLSSSLVLLKRFGRVFVSFDKPIVLSEFMAARNFDPASNTDEEKKRFIKALAHQIITGMNESVTVTPASLIALVLLSTKTRALRKDRFLAIALDVLGMLQASYPEIRLSDALLNDTEASLDTALSLLAKDGQIVKKESENLSYVLAPSKKARALNFYKNTIIHFFVSDALIACAFRAACLHQKRAQVPLEAVKARVLTLSQIFKFEFSFSPLHSFDEMFSLRIAFLKERQIFLHQEGDLLLAPTLQAKEDIDFLSRILHPFFETYFVAFDDALSEDITTLLAKDFVPHVLRHLSESIQSGLITRPEAVNKQSCEAAFQFLKSLTSKKELFGLFKAITDVLDSME